MKNLNNWRIRIIGMAIQNLIFFLFFYLRQILEGGHAWFKVIGWQLLFIAVIWESTRLSIYIARKKFPALQQMRARIGFLAALLLLMAIALGCWHVGMELWLGFWQSSALTIYSFLYSIGMTLFFCQLIAGVYEALYYLEQWKLSVQKSEALEKRDLQSRLDALRNQVSPHFLFNSLNSLTALVEENPKAAVRFIEALAGMYRYLLQSNEHELTTLRRELEFMDGYVFLLKTRFEEGLYLEKEVAPDLLDYQLPPLTLQILVENAVKHNMISASMPLYIRVYTDAANNLIVTNNLQKRKTHIPSNKTGLLNISAKFTLLNQPDIIINETPTHFQVSIPLMKSHSNELSYH